MLEHGRKIATILAAHVVEYSRLMDVDDSGTLAALKVRRALFEQLVGEFDGREFGSVGDSLMAQFPSAVNAVRCAQAIQQAVARENESLPPERRMTLRMGVNLGDVIEENGTLFGDGVNVAARLQSLAAPGGVLISGAVYEHVKKRLSARLKFAGARHVKNIPDPIATYEVLDADVRRSLLKELIRRARSLRVAALSVLVVLGVGAALWRWGGDITSMQPRSTSTAAATPAIAVLPFVDLTENHANAPFCDGLTEELLNSLAQLPNLRVVARTSVFMFRDAARDVREIGRQLGVTHVLEGSVRRSGERVRITAHLANAQTGYHDWSDDFERPFTDSLDIQQEIAHAVVGAMQVSLTKEDEVRLAEPRARDMRAYESYLLGRYHQLQRTPESLAKAFDYYRAAINRDPQFALAYAGLADAHMAGYYYMNRPIEDVEAQMLPLIERAIDLDPRLAEAYASRGTLHSEQWRLKSAQKDLMRAVALSPNSADGYVRLGAALEYDGR
ncbi:MAG: adenylate/guanylate cyclase domain-containing protein, partial [Steroidobacteraceae bacterium]